jgi:small-conductance mechanosensitive channel
MKRLNTLPAVILAVLLLGCLVAVFLTRDAATGPAPPRKPAASNQPSAVDSSLLQTANQIAALAETADEQNQGLEALHLADHELDQAFATALRQAASYRPPATGPLRELHDRISQLQAQIAADQDHIAQLTKQTSSSAADQLELTKAQLALDQDELEDAQQDLALQGGDPHATLERALQDHETTQHQTAAQAKSGPGPTGTLVEQARSWFSLKSRDQQLLAAEQQATAHTNALTAEHNLLQKQISSAPADAGTQGTADSIASLHRLSEQRKTLSELSQRMQDSKQLAGVYQSWSTLAETRKRTVLHLLLGSLAEIFAILLVAFLANLAIRQLFHQADQERRHQVRVMAAVVVQLVAVVLILLVLFGPPSQVSTIIGLATAGLTVVLKDFIVAFFGWFALMGKNGIRVGDWVEINGVSGEVIEIGLLKTVLLELGNWADTGHPTGRQVAFSNSFAMEGHYFNFSTSGQWLWDEVQMTLPAAGDPYLMAEEIRKLVERETESDSVKASQDWEHVTSQFGARSFSAKPSVNLRPGINGLDVAVRYITRAPQRYAVKSKLFQLIVDLLHKPAGKEPAALSEPRS